MTRSASARLAWAHPIIFASVAIVLAAVAAAAAWALLGWTANGSFRERIDALYATRSGPRRTVDMTFRFRGRTHTVTAAVDEAFLASARSAPTEVVFNSDAIARDRYVRELIAREAAGPFIDQLGSGFRELRDRLGLDADGYVELMAAAVQQLTYGTPAWRFDLPEVVVARRTGVCSDRSVLLAALLVHEGYDTCLWVFEREAHVAVGVRGVGTGFHGSGYAFVETTHASFIGDAGSIYQVARLANWEPQRVSVGGSRRYTSDVLAAFVVSKLADDGADTRTDPDYATFAREAGSNWRECYARAADEHVVTTDREAWVRDHCDDLPRVYAAITRSGVGR